MGPRLSATGCDAVVNGFRPCRDRNGRALAKSSLGYHIMFGLWRDVALNGHRLRKPFEAWITQSSREACTAMHRANRSIETRNRRRRSFTSCKEYGKLVRNFANKLIHDDMHPSGSDGKSPIYSQAMQEHPRSQMC